MSDWERRPLSAQQLHYAALDAHAAVQIFRGMGALFHALSTHQGLALHATTWEAGRAQSGAAPLEPTRDDPPPPDAAGGHGGGHGGGFSGAQAARPASSAPAGSKRSPCGGAGSSVQRRTVGWAGLQRPYLTAAAKVLLRCRIY